MNLQIDAGNTALKWRVVECSGSRVVETGSIHLGGGGGNTLEALVRELPEMSSGSITRIQVANARGRGFTEMLREATQQKFGLAPEFASSTRQCQGVTNGYAEPGLLGVDRWLAIVSAFNLCRAACWIIGCGTTITADFVDDQGRHQGGFIVPGLGLMRNMLGERIPHLAVSEAELPALRPGHNTAEAINNGVLAMAAGFIAALKAAADREGLHQQWLLFGGDAELLKSVLQWEVRVVPSLVLDGLMLALP